MHWLWRFMDETHPRYVKNAPPELRLGLQNVYQKMDETLAELFGMVGEDTLVMLMSDHGAGPLETYFHVNTWLVDQGFIQFKRDPAVFLKRFYYQLGITPIGLYKLIMALRQGQQLARTMRTRKLAAVSLLQKLFLSFDNVNWQKSSAYSLGNFGQIYINLKGREPLGIISPGSEYEQVVNDITNRLYKLSDPRTGRYIKGKVYRRDEIYHGSHLEDAPDIVFMPDDLRLNGFGQYQFPSKSWLELTFDRSGGHRMDGTFMLFGPGVLPGKQLKPNIIDLAPTILACMGLPIPDDMDGIVLKEAFDENYFINNPINYSPTQFTTKQHVNQFPMEIEEEIKEQLRGLGYMA
jgi:predicted AlkP superfamily phosphohydrolase/phosphomutase